MNKTIPLLSLAGCCLMTPLHAQQTIEVGFDPDVRGEPINPFIYGQFIEHLGRCIYGGIWAEMLEDRKFFYPVTEDYDPYVEFEDTEFPAIGASPWEILGEAEGVTMIAEDSFVGEHTPRLGAGTAIRHHDLGVVQGGTYEGYIWLRAAEDSPARVVVSLEVEGSPAQKHTIEVTPGEYAQHDFSFEAPAASDEAMFTIRVEEGTALVGTAALMPADNVNGMRADTLALLKELDSPLYRWPGGNFVSGYDWRDGIGDRDRRPPRKNPAWVGLEHNDFGTDEFIAFCRELDTVPMIAANTGFGDAYSAAQWIEYCNSGKETIGGRWRIENGNEQPYDVKYWCVGNEMFGPWQLGFMQLHHYTQKHNWVADAMLEVDPDLVLVGVGAIGEINEDHDPQAAEAERGWSQGMLEESADHMDLISEHAYRGRVPWTDEGRAPVQEHVMMLKESIRSIADRHRALQAKLPNLEDRTVPISLDEWNYWHRDYVYGDLGCIYDHADGLGTVVALHEFFRQSDIIEVANYAQTVNVIGAIKTTRTAAEFESTGLALKLYRQHFAEIPLTFDDAFAPYDVMAAVSKDGSRMTVSVVNPTNEAATVKLDVADTKLPAEARRWRLTADDPLAHNTPGQPRQVDILEDGSVDIAEGLSVPPLTAALFEIQL